MDVTLTIRNARPQDVQQFLNLRRPRRDRSPLRRQRPHVPILSNQQQDALQALDFRADQDTPSVSHSVSRPHQTLEPLPRRRREETYEGTRAKHKARPYSAFPGVQCGEHQQLQQLRLPIKGQAKQIEIKHQVLEILVLQQI